MAYKEYIFSLQKKSFEFWQPEKDNIVATNQPYFLHFAPDGWEGFSIKNSRNKNYWGVDRTVSLPFNYVEDGADILKYIMYTLGIEESVYLTICKLQMEYNTKPMGVISTNNLVQGDNLGTIKGDANSTVYIKVVVAGAAQDSISGMIGENFVGQFPSTKIYAVKIGENGQAIFNVFFDKSGTSTASFIITDSDGDAFASYGFWYKQIYRGEVDLSEFKHNGTKVTCTTLEDGLAKHLKANENTTFELPMNNPNAVWVKMDGIKLHNSTTYTLLNTQAGGSQFAIFKNLSTLPLFYSAQEGDGFGVSYLNVNPEEINNTGVDTGYLTNGNWMFSNDGTTPVTFPLSGNIDFLCMVNEVTAYTNKGLLNLYFKTSGGVKYSITANNNIVTKQSYSIPFNFTITLNAGEKLYAFKYIQPVAPFLYTVVGGGNVQSLTYTQIEYKETSKAALKAITRRPTTYIRALTSQYIFNELINKVTEGNYKAAYCKYLSDNNQIKWTSGNAIRGFDDAVLKISLSEFFQFYNCFDAVGIQEIGKTVLLDSKENLIDESKIIPLGIVSDISISVAKEYLFNVLNIGYPPISSDVGTLNGNEEFNCGFQFSFGTTKGTGVLDKVSKTSASCYEIEKIRTTTLNKDTTDYKNDNKNFVLFTENGSQNDRNPSYFKLDRSLNASATGLLEPLTVFNIPLSPKRMLLRNGNFIRSSMYLADNLILKYTSSEKNNKLVCGGIIEKADIAILNLGTRYFYPLLISFTVPAPLDLIGLLDLNPLSIFSIVFNGKTYTGILQEVSTASDTNTSQNYTLLCTSDNDLKTLINYYG